MTIGYGDLRKGMAIELEGEPYLVVDYERSKMQQRAPTMRIRFKEIRSGKVLDKSFSGYDVKLTPADVERRSAQYILPRRRPVLLHGRRLVRPAPPVEGSDRG